MTRPLPDFELQRPRTLAAALAALGADGALPVAGGTDLLPNLRRGLLAPSRLVDLTAVEDLAAVAREATHWRLGAGVTLAALAADRALADALPALGEAAASVAGPGHRSAATLGGNLCQDTRCVFYNQSAWWRQANGWCLKRAGDTCHVAPQGRRCHAAYQGDLAAALIACDAVAELHGPQGSRTLPLHALYRDDGAAHLQLEPGELLAAVQVPHPPEGTRMAYRKQRTRAAMDFPLAGVAVALRVHEGRLAALAVGITGTNSNPLRLAGTDALVGRPCDAALADELGRLVARQTSPMRSTVTAANHRRLVAVAAARRLLLELAATAEPASR